MQNGISGAPIPASLPYAAPIQAACERHNVPPLLAYAIACRESIIGEINGKWCARTVQSGDGGHGLFQLTSSYPPNWDDAATNAEYGVAYFIKPALVEWTTRVVPAYQGDDLIRCVAATFNAGFGGAWDGHSEGDVDRYTTDDYGAGVLDIYHELLHSGKP